MEQGLTWRRARGFRIAHAFAEGDLTTEAGRIEPVAHCGWWLIADLKCDEDAERCRSCTATVTR